LQGFFVFEIDVDDMLKRGDALDDFRKRLARPSGEIQRAASI
jgi:hypothetical protein